MRVLIALLGVILSANAAASVAINGYPGTCFPQPGVQLPEPSTNEPFIASGIIELDDISGFGNPYSYAIYRVGCPGGGAAVLVKFRSTGLPSGRAPTISVVQGATSISSVRYATEPYTVSEGIGREENIDLGRVVILNSGGIDFKAPMTIRIRGRSSATVEVPAFNAFMYPNASAPIPITGYVSGLYYDATKPGEGMQVEVSDSGTIVMTWYTFDSAGRPLWLAGAGPACAEFFCFGPPSHSVITVAAFTGGGFAGNFDPASVRSETWGTVRLEWNSCLSVLMTLTPSHNGATLPSATGQRQWARLTSIGGASCG